MRSPEHTIQFLNYGYSQYIRKVLELAEIDPEKIEWWTAPLQLDTFRRKIRLVI